MEDFSLILDSGETILKTYKPNKKRFTLISFIGALPSLIFPIGFLVLGILMITQVIQVVDENNNPDYMPGIMMSIFASIFVFFVLAGFFSTFFRYKKAMYCITNKRIIIRHGFIGVDFKSLDLKAIGAVNVQVDFLDKLVKPNTGKITFASSSAPLTTQNQKGQIVPFEFACVDNPYDVYREIKELINLNVEK